MIVTEQEAAQHWCPQARIVRNETLNTPNASHDVLIGGVNRDALSPARHDRVFPHSCRCIASNCMLWRWDDAQHGHCGLAGPASRFETRTRAAEKRTEIDRHQRLLAQAESELEEITHQRAKAKE